MYNFSGNEVPQSVIDDVTQLVSLPQQPVCDVTETILKYLTGVEGVNKEVMAQAVAEFASTTGIEIGQAQGLVKVLLNILKASYRGGLTSTQVEADFQNLSGSVEATRSIVGLWSKYVQKSDTVVSTDTAQPDATPASSNTQPAPSAASDPAPVSAAAEVPAPETGVPADGSEPAAEPPLSPLDDVLGEGAALGALDELQDIQWSFGVTAASSDPARVGRTFVRLALHVRAPEGRPAVRHVQLSVTQFYSLLHQLEKARAVARFM